MLFYKKQDAAKAEALRTFVGWALDEGQQMSGELGYIPLPDPVKEKVRGHMDQIGSAA
jgi:phosphate transport system substrate-binding protein